MSDFLAKCVVKVPANRASAESLLKHPFVVGAVKELTASGGKCAVLMDLVSRCLPLMDDFRAGLEKEGDDNTLGAGGTLIAQNSVGSIDATS